MIGNVSSESYIGERHVLQDKARSTSRRAWDSSCNPQTIQIKHFNTATCYQKGTVAMKYECVHILCGWVFVGFTNKCFLWMLRGVPPLIVVGLNMSFAFNFNMAAMTLEMFIMFGRSIIDFLPLVSGENRTKLPVVTASVRHSFETCPDRMFAISSAVTWSGCARRCLATDMCARECAPSKAGATHMNTPNHEIISVKTSNRTTIHNCIATCSLLKLRMQHGQPQ